MKRIEVRLRKRLVSVLLCCMLVILLPACSPLSEWLPNRSGVSRQPMKKESGVSYAFRTSGKYLERWNGKDFETFYVQGVNIGAGKPNSFAGEMGISREDYQQWFELISDMGANAVRVYTVLGPEFYEAFYEYNTTHENKLYLFQGCWYDEDILLTANDAFMTLKSVQKDLKDLADIIHGKAEVQPRPGHASGSYSWDISNYVAGWILGIESDAFMINVTNNVNKDTTGYSGAYLTCKDVLPYEVFWCQIGDYVLSYEDKTYHTQRPVSFTNWPTADMLSHPNEANPTEDDVAVNVENIRAGERFLPGLFASYHIYPYYPDFMFRDVAYAEYVDEEGRPNPYRGYLEDLIAHHTYPVLVAEFGVPASRGVAHINPITGYNQGGNTEEEQGAMLVSMFKDIRKAGYAGGLIFAWQDEWFKKVWNAWDYNNADRRVYWNDVQTCEQHYGLMEFVSSENWPTPMLDGETGDWMDDDLVLQGARGETVYAKTDSTYLYLMVNAPGADYDRAGAMLYFDITPEVGSTIYGETRFELPVDIVLEINGREDTRLMIHRDSDLYHFLNAQNDTSVKELFDSSVDGFGPLYQLLCRSVYLPQTKERIPVQRVETGRLLYGSTDESREEYSSLADFCYEGDVLEARIPWQLLGFRDPSLKEVQGYFINTGITGGVNVDGITVGLITPEGDAGYGFFTWNNWSQALAYSRLRKSYYIVREYLTGLQEQAAASAP